MKTFSGEGRKPVTKSSILELVHESSAIAEEIEYCMRL